MQEGCYARGHRLDIRSIGWELEVVLPHRDIFGQYGLFGAFWPQSVRLDDPGRFITMVDLAGDTAWGGEPLRYYRLDHDTLTTWTDCLSYPLFPGRSMRGDLTWRREIAPLGSNNGNQRSIAGRQASPNEHLRQISDI